MTILSWNYDAHFEMAYAGYAVNGRYIPTQWKELNVFNKTFPTDYNSSNEFSIIKLNGTAFFTDNRENYAKTDGRIYSKLHDNYFGGTKMDKYELAYEVLCSNNDTYFNPSLSYAWEKDNISVLLDKVQKRVQNTQELIIIGYSFPYVNRIVDTQIIQSMDNLKNIFIQDPEYNDIEQRVMSMLTPEQKTNVKCQNKTNKKQFYLPNSFE